MDERDKPRLGRIVDLIRRTAVVTDSVFAREIKEGQQPDVVSNKVHNFVKIVQAEFQDVDDQSLEEICSEVVGAYLMGIGRGKELSRRT